MMRSKILFSSIISLLIILSIYIILTPVHILAKETKYGVFVGVGKYPNEAQTLLSSANDATEMCKAFSKNCGKENTTLILDEQATRENILNSIKGYIMNKDVESGNLFVFYYSGHGTLFPDRFSEKRDEKLTKKITIKNGKAEILQTKEIYDAALIPFDAATNTGERNWRNLILDDELFDIFSKLTKKGVRVVFISDSCYSGGQAKSLDLTGKVYEILGREKFLDWKEAIGIKDEDELKTSILLKQEFKVDYSLDNLYILVASSKADEPSYSRSPEKGNKMSLFTYYFLNTFQKYKSLNKPFTFEVLENEVSPKVIKYVERYNKLQSPNIDKTIYKGDLNISIF